jgi:hypothetical protein
MFGDYSLIWCKGIENGVADWLSRAPLLGGYCPDDGEMEKEKYKFDDEGNLIFNEIDDSGAAATTAGTRHLKCSPPTYLEAVRSRSQWHTMFIGLRRGDLSSPRRKTSIRKGWKTKIRRSF